MSKFPSNFDDDVTLPFVNDNLTEIGAEAINAVRDAVFNIEQYLGLGADGTTGSVANRIGISLNLDGTIKPSAITGLGLVTLPITNAQISSSAEIQESKLKLDYRTSDLFNYIKDLSADVNTSLGWISSTGSKLDPHLLGFAFVHTLSQIAVTDNPALGFKDKFKNFRDNSNAFTALTELNNELLYHQFADGYATETVSSITTNNGTSSYPSSYAHLSSGIFIDTDRFSTIPQTANDLQKFANYIDSASIFLLGTRIQNLFSNGISRESRSANLVVDGYGQEIVPSTQVTTYLLNIGNNSSPFDDINTGDDIVEFKPSSSDMSSNSFDAKFALVKVGDIIRINYDGVEISHIIKEKKYVQTSGNKKYSVRIEGKNLKYSTTASARIDKPLLNNNKYAALAVAAANNNFSEIPSLIAVNARSASALGIGFNPDLIDSEHYVLYLALYPTGNPADGYTILPGIDITGNAGATPGKYTLESIIESTNNAFRASGFNYRFVAFQYQGEFGIALADSYNNTSFSILSGIIGSNGSYDASATAIAFPKNIVGLTSATSLLPLDPLGFGPTKANLASPPYSASYDTADASQTPTKIFIPLKRNNFYVNGFEIEKFGLDKNQIQDKYGDGYWLGTIYDKNIYPGPVPVGRVEVTYRIPLDLSTSGLAVGKTIVIQKVNSGGLVNFGRFIIQSINSSCGSVDFTDITVYDAVHANAVSPTTTLDIGSEVAIYLDYSSISFNKESATDLSIVSPFKRHFEVLINQNGETFTHERARINASSSTININGSVPLYTYSELNKLNIVRVSPKLRGYQFGNVNKISLYITQFTSYGTYVGYLCYYDGVGTNNLGPITQGRVGEITRFYDESNIDYIDILFDANVTVSAFNNQALDFQLFPTLSLDNEIMLIATCQLDDITKKVTNIKDERAFGNIGEKDLGTSALNYISTGEKLLHANGVIRGFDLQTTGVNPNSNQIYINGGVALVNGKFIQVNKQTVVIPIIKELYSSVYYNINWALCINDRGEYQPIPMLDVEAGTPGTSNRLFRAYNPANGLSYNLEATTFSNIINNKKNLTLLYVVSSTVVQSPLSISLSITDARRFVNDLDNNFDLKLANFGSQGNFQNIESIFNWIKYNNLYNGTAIVKGSSEGYGIIAKPITLDFISNVVIDGQNDAIITFNKPVTFGSNITFRNINLLFKNKIFVKENSSNIIFENCHIVITNELADSISDNNVIFNVKKSNNIKFDDCILDVGFKFNATSGALFLLDSANKFIVNDTKITLDFNVDPNDGYVPGTMFIIKNSPSVKLTSCIFEGNFAQCIRNTLSDGLVLKDSYIKTSYNPLVASPDTFDNVTDYLNTSDGLSAVTYDVNNLVNNGRAVIYSKINTSLDNIIIDNVEFIHDPIDTVFVISNRFSFINFELSSNTSILSNVNITNCKFKNIRKTDRDIRSAISIINTSAQSSSNQQQPLLKNINIKNNYFGKNQGIVLTSVLRGDSMSYPGLVTEKCIIENNTCGSIGYWVGSSSKVIDLFPNDTSLSDKDSSLIISGNNCHNIMSTDHNGKYYLPIKLVAGQTVNTCAYPSGNVVIENNICNWIHTAITFEENSSLKILNNSLTAYYTGYLEPYDNTLVKSLSPAYAITVFSNRKAIPNTQAPGEGNDASCIISGNTTSTGYWLQTNSTPYTYKYIQGYICTTASSIITNNIFKGLYNFGDSGLLYSDLIIVGGKTNIVKNNKVYREGNSISSYVRFNSFNLPFWDGLGSYGEITDNFFDSAYLSGNSEIESGLFEWSMPSYTVPGTWIVERNINQTGYILVPLTTGSYSDNSLIYSTTPLWKVTSVYNLTGNFKSIVLRVTDSVDPPELRQVGFQQSLNAYLPNNVKILKAEMGVRSFGNDTDASASNRGVKLNINKYFIDTMQTSDRSGLTYTNLDYLADLDLDQKVPDDLVNSTPYLFISSAELNSTSSTIIKNIDFTAINPATGGPGSGNLVPFYTVNYRYPFTLSVEISVKKIAGTNLTIGISPISIRYRW